MARSSGGITGRTSGSTGRPAPRARGGFGGKANTPKASGLPGQKNDIQAIAAAQAKQALAGYDANVPKYVQRTDPAAITTAEQRRASNQRTRDRGLADLLSTRNLALNRLGIRATGLDDDDPSNDKFELDYDSDPASQAALLRETWKNTKAANSNNIGASGLSGAIDAQNTYDTDKENLGYRNLLEQGADIARNTMRSRNDLLASLDDDEASILQMLAAGTSNIENPHYDKTYEQKALAAALAAMTKKPAKRSPEAPKISAKERQRQAGITRRLYR